MNADKLDIRTYHRSYLSAKERMVDAVRDDAASGLKGCSHARHLRKPYEPLIFFFSCARRLFCIMLFCDLMSRVSNVVLTGLLHSD